MATGSSHRPRKCTETVNRVTEATPLTHYHPGKQGRNSRGQEDGPHEDEPRDRQGLLTGKRDEKSSLRKEER
jgi:hypothetical protein